MTDKLEVEVFRAGDYGEKGAWSEETLDQMAADYDPALHEAPVTLDHAQQGPALGWVEALRRVGDRLVARLRGMNGKLLELIGQGAFKKRSVEIYPALRETGRPYVRAVSFLGAAVPEVKGLADPALNNPALADTAAGMPFGEREEQSVAFEEEDAPALVAIEPEATPQGVNAGEGEGNDNANINSNDNFISFSEVAVRLRETGKWQPAWGERGIAAFYEALAGAGEIEVGEGRRVGAAEWFTGFLESLAPVVALGEAAPAGSALGPRAANVDPASLSLHQSVVCLQQAHPGMSYGEALRCCAAGR